VVNACRPWDRIKSFPITAEVSPELRAHIKAKWPDLFK
jgi:hypothetical protein